MNELTLIKTQSGWCVDSREVAEMTEVRHSDLLEKINGYFIYLLNGKFRPVDFFIKSSYVDSTGRTLPCYLLTRKGCDMVANKMTGEKGVLFTAAYVTKFEEMEKQIQPQFRIPQTYPEALRLAADLVEKNTLLAPKAESYDTFISKENLYPIGEVAKKLAIPNMGEKNLFVYLRGRKILCGSRAHWNEPYQEYVNMGYFVVRECKPWTDKKGAEHQEKQTFVTPKGIGFIARMLKKDGYIKEMALSHI